MNAHGAGTCHLSIDMMMDMSNDCAPTVSDIGTTPVRRMSVDLVHGLIASTAHGTLTGGVINAWNVNAIKVVKSSVL